MVVKEGGQVFCLQLWDMERESPGKKKTPNNRGEGLPKFAQEKH